MLTKLPCAKCGKSVLTGTKRQCNVKCKKCQFEKNLWTNYKMTVDIYSMLLKYQNNKCLICSKLANKCKLPGNARRKYGLIVDHCHSTKRVRGLICQNSNIMLGSCQDDVDILQKGIEYLSR